MNSFILQLRTGRLLWTILVTFYFIVFFTNFFSDTVPELRIIPLLFAYTFVLWLAVEYYFGSPFFQSGFVAPSPLWRGVFAFFVYPYLGYLAADFIWWEWTQIPINYLITGIPGLLLFGLGVYLRLATLFSVLGIAQIKTEAGEIVFPPRRFLNTEWQKLCRHPRYLAIFIQLLGAALVFRSWGGLVLTVFIGLPLILVQARYEERLLVQALKTEFTVYAGVTPFLFPRLTGKKAD